MAGDYSVPCFESEVDKQSQSNASSFGFPSNKSETMFKVDTYYESNVHSYVTPFYHTLLMPVIHTLQVIDTTMEYQL